MKQGMIQKMQQWQLRIGGCGAGGGGSGKTAVEDALRCYMQMKWW